MGWYLDNSDGVPHPVGQKKPNELGIYDMSGLATEFTGDGVYPYSEEAQENPHYTVPDYEEFIASDMTRKLESICSRGGDYFRPARDTRTSSRVFHFITQRGGAGFRVVCSK